MADEITIQLTRQQVLALRDGKPVRIELTLKPDRRGTFEERPAAGQLQPDVAALVAAWNARAGAQRVSPEEALAKEGELRRLLRKVGGEKAGVEVAAYWDAVEAGRSTWDGRDHRCKSLFTFAASVLRHAKDRRRGWWHREAPGLLPDDHPELTRAVADAFARRFLGREAYGLENPSRDYAHFREAGDWIEHSLARSSFFPDAAVVIHHLMACLERAADGRAVYPSQAGSETTWRVLFPQYLKTVL